MQGSLFAWKTSWLLSHAMKECEVANFHGQASDAYAYVWMVQGSLFSWITLWNLCHILNRCKVAYFHGKRHAMKECQVANFHGQASYAYVWMVQSSLFSWITLWNLCHTLNRCKGWPLDSPKVHYSEGLLVRRSVSPKVH
jgi:uncharacterized membrane protein YiaA